MSRYSAGVFVRRQFLVTGGTGFIGRHVVWRLVNQGVPVRVLSRSTEKANALFGNRVEIVHGDLLDAASLRSACKGVHTIIHAGGVYRFGRHHRRELFDTNVCGSGNLLEAAWVSRIERFIHISSAGILNNPSAPVTERDFPGSVSVREPYRCSKWQAELTALDWAKRGLPVSIGSPTSTLGAEDAAPTPTGCMVRDFLKRRFPFAARTALNFIHVDDLANGILAVADRGQAGKRYLLGHHNLWLAEFLNLLARASELPAPRRQLPWGVIAIVGGVGELLGPIAANGCTRVCWETAAYARRQQFFDLRKTSEDLGWRAQTPIEDIVRDAVRWFQGLEQGEIASPSNLQANTNVAAN
ncbi:MAG: NAD-dependent epimerase/dehydratase family protein [Verrucomicrobia bacterium]|nr:NAD-dependent epimerase/dehydratase family protein [Verrucomicrobiota bacterium]